MLKECKPPPTFALCCSNFCTLGFAKVSTAFALYRMMGNKKSDATVAFYLPITYDQFSTGFTSFISSDRISQFKLSDTEIFKQFPDIRWSLMDNMTLPLLSAITLASNSYCSQPK